MRGILTPVVKNFVLLDVYRHQRPARKDKSARVRGDTHEGYIDSSSRELIAAASEAQRRRRKRAALVCRLLLSGCCGFAVAYCVTLLAPGPLRRLRVHHLHARGRRPLEQWHMPRPLVWASGCRGGGGAGGDGE